MVSPWTPLGRAYSTAPDSPAAQQFFSLLCLSKNWHPQKIAGYGTDDTLLYDTNIENAFYHMWDYLFLCAQTGTVINEKKFKFCRDTIEFTGLKLTLNDVAPSNTVLSAIKDFQKPTDLMTA